MDRALRITAIVLGLVGLGVTIYLTYVHYADKVVACGIGGHGCQTVQGSRYAMLLGIPLSVFGMASYIGLLVALAIDGGYGRLGAAFMAFVGVGFSVYLAYREIFTIHAFCIWCTVSAVALVILTVITVLRLLRDTPSAPVGVA